MTDTNTYIAQQAAEVEPPISFTTVTTPASDARAEVQKLLNLIAQEGSNSTDHRGNLDEMSPACRTTLYSTLLALQAAL